MTPKKKPDAPIEVTVASVSPDIEDKHVEAVRSQAGRERLWLAVIGAIVTLASIGQTLAVTYMQSQTRDAVSKGTSEVREQTKEVADKLEETRDIHSNKLDELKKISDETNETGQATNVLVNSGALINARLYVAALKRLVALQNDPGDIEELKKAQQLVTEHEEGQKVLDSRAKKKQE